MVSLRFARRLLSPSSSDQTSSALISVGSPGSSRSCAKFSLSTSLLKQYNLVGTMPSSGGGALTFLWQALSTASVLAETVPNRTSLRMSTKRGSEAWRTGCCRSVVLKLQLPQAAVWKQKLRSASACDTGGNCRKSPQSSSCKPPNGSALPRIRRATSSSLLKSAPSSMDTSSTTRTLDCSHRFAACSFFWILLTSRCTSPYPSPMPAKLCRV
mmetsp:Transcript_117908/g.306122  ORF Transcript_117908/g.306122 Transcript_117908/m.306122 type:complete len:213 (-) Transcript_117908:508-1146(-)